MQEQYLNIFKDCIIELYVWYVYSFEQKEKTNL